MEPLFFAKDQFFDCQNRKKTGAKLGTCPEPVLEMPRWKRDNTEPSLLPPFVQEKAPNIPALSHVVCIGGPDHEERNISQSHQQVLASTWLPISAPP